MYSEVSETDLSFIFHNNFTFAGTRIKNYTNTILKKKILPSNNYRRG